MEKLENIFDPQKNYYYGGTAPADVRTKMSQALYNHRIARESHARGDLVGAVFFSKQLLCIKFPETTSHDKMLTED